MIKDDIKNNIERDLYIVGDIHGEFETFKKNIKHADNTNFILVGDIGLGFHKDKIYNKWFPKWNEELVRKNNNLYFIRGNHDDPSFWNEDKINLSNINLVKDYDVLNINNKNILCVGGAISVDRKFRKEGVSYWKDEIFVLEEEKLNKLNNVDIVVTHSCPEFVYPRGYDTSFLKKYYYNDPELRDELIIERTELNIMYNIITYNNNIKSWYYGHFHKRYTEYHNDIMFRLCDIHEIVKV